MFANILTIRLMLFASFLVMFSLRLRALDYPDQDGGTTNQVLFIDGNNFDKKLFQKVIGGQQSNQISPQIFVSAFYSTLLGINHLGTPATTISRKFEATFIAKTGDKITTVNANGDRFTTSVPPHQEEKRISGSFTIRPDEKMTSVTVNISNCVTNSTPSQEKETRSLASPSISPK